MKISVPFAILDKEMMTASSLFSDKHLAEDTKSAIMWIKDGVLRLSAYNGNIVTSTIITEAEVTFSEGESATDEYFHCIRAKEITDVLNTYKGLQKTVADLAEFTIVDNSVILEISEVPADSVDDANRHLYELKTSFRLNKQKTKQLFITSLTKLDTETKGEVVDSQTVVFYLDLLYPTVARETLESATSITFSETHVYAVLPTYVALVDCAFGSDESRVELPQVMKGFKLVNSSASFLRSLVGQQDSFEMTQTAVGRGAVELLVRTGDTVASITCPDLSRAHNITQVLEVPENGIVIDKGYLLDVLKRVSLNPEPATIHVTINGTVAEMNIKSKLINQSIPVLAGKGEGEYMFQMKAEMLSNLIFGQSKSLGDSTFIYIEKSPETGKIALAVKDSTKIWMTKAPQLHPVNAHSSW